MAIEQGEQIIEGNEPPPPPPSPEEKWIEGGVRAFFTKPTALANLLEPLVQTLGWRGTYRQLIESLPHFSEDLTLTDFFNVMVAINYNHEKAKMRLSKVPQKFMPCLFIPDDGVAMVLLAHANEDDDKVGIIN